VSDLHTPAVEDHIQSDASIIQTLMVSGTPTVYFDGEKDPGKKRYKGVKVK
jgi:hypothetical protein